MTLVEGATQRLKIHLLVILMILLVAVDHAHLHIVKIQTLPVHLIMLLIQNSLSLARVSRARGRLANLMSLELLL